MMANLLIVANLRMAQVVYFAVVTMSGTGYGDTLSM